MFSWMFAQAQIEKFRQMTNGLKIKQIRRSMTWAYLLIIENENNS